MSRWLLGVVIAASAACGGDDRGSTNEPQCPENGGLRGPVEEGAQAAGNPPRGNPWGGVRQEQVLPGRFAQELDRDPYADPCPVPVEPNQDVDARAMRGESVAAGTP